MSDTIVALASGPPPAGIAVIRVSGEAAREAVEPLLGGGAFPAARRAGLRSLVDPADGSPLDDALVLWFPGPASYTGEDMVELHCHGGVATIDAALDVLIARPGCRRAEPGEFSRRAFANGRMDLPEIEGLADLIAAETDAQRRLALRQARGMGNDRYRDWTDRLIRVAAALEAAVDFPEDDLPESILTRNEIEMRALSSEWEQHIELGRLSAGVRDGVHVAIVGAPNVGKSSLLNRLAGREAAIVSESAGTTRDVVEVRLVLRGVPVTLSDTAGLREATDLVEQEGVRRARAVAAGADLVLWLSDDASAFAGPAPVEASGARVLRVRTKTDVSGFVDEGPDLIGISSTSGEGLERLVEILGAHISTRLEGAELAVATRQRHRDALARAAEALHRALGQTDLGLAGEDTRAAIAEIGRITGRVDVEHVLDALFGEFCIGK
jgi:tRNA modification GTPase